MASWEYLWLCRFQTIPFDLQMLHNRKEILIWGETLSCSWNEPCGTPAGRFSNTVMLNFTSALHNMKHFYHNDSLFPVGRKNRQWLKLGGKWGGRATTQAERVTRAVAVSCWWVWDFRQLTLSRDSLVSDLLQWNWNHKVFLGTASLNNSWRSIAQQTCWKLGFGHCSIRCWG